MQVLNVPKGIIQEQLLDMWQAEMYVTASVANTYTVRCMGVSVEKMERQVRMLLQACRAWQCWRSATSPACAQCHDSAR